MKKIVNGIEREVPLLRFPMALPPVEYIERPRRKSRFNWSLAYCLAGSAVCFGMFFYFGPTPDNQMTAVFGLVCLFFAYICYDASRP